MPYNIPSHLVIKHFQSPKPITTVRLHIPELPGNHVSRKEVHAACAEQLSASIEDQDVMPRGRNMWMINLPSVKDAALGRIHGMSLRGVPARLELCLDTAPQMFVCHSVPTTVGNSDIADALGAAFEGNLIFLRQSPVKDERPRKLMAVFQDRVPLYGFDVPMRQSSKSQRPRMFNARFSAVHPRDRCAVCGVEHITYGCDSLQTLRAVGQHPGLLLHLPGFK